MNTIPKIKKIMVRGVSGKAAEIEVSGTPGPNSVGTEEIQDEGIKKQDLEKDIQDKLDLFDDANIMLPEEAVSRVQDIIGSLDSEYNSQDAGNDANGETADPEDI